MLSGPRVRSACPRRFCNEMENWHITCGKASNKAVIDLCRHSDNHIWDFTSECESVIVFSAHSPCTGNCMLYVITLKLALRFGLLRLLNQWVWLWLRLGLWLGSQLGQGKHLPFRLGPQIRPYVNCDVTQVRSRTWASYPSNALKQQISG